MVMKTMVLAVMIMLMKTMVMMLLMIITMTVVLMVMITLATPVPALCLQSLRSENENLFKTLKKSFCQFSLLMSVWWIQKHLPHRVLNVKILNKQK